MGQVPAENSSGVWVRPLLIGDGKLARHLHFYFGQLGIPCANWSRRSPGTLAVALAGSFLNGASSGASSHDESRITHALIAVSDSAIEGIAAQCAELAPKIRRVHFSGSLTTPLAHGAHPLMSFPATLFTPERYPRIPFVTERGGPAFSDLLPGFPNPHFAINPDEKARYHALCVLSGNFTVLLWQKFFTELGDRFGIPRESALEYLKAIATNLEAESFPFTGPLARGDDATIARNLAALEGDPYRAVYISFVEAYRRAISARHPQEAPAVL